MAAYTKIGKKWRVRIRKKGFPGLSEMFDTKARAQEWANRQESDMQARKFNDVRMIADTTLNEMIDRYSRELADTKPFGRNKKAVLAMLKKSIGAKKMPELTSHVITEHVKNRIAAGAGGVTVAIDLTYLGSVLRAAKSIWKLPVDVDVFTEARAYMAYIGVSTRSKERTRRTSDDELSKIKDHFRAKKSQRIPMWDIIDFAVATAMRDAEIMRIHWDDVNHTDRTVIIRDRKHPTKKSGNDQVVPLLRPAWEIVQRQPHREGPIFPYSPHTVSSIFTRVVKEVGISDLHFHDLRHEGVSRLFELKYGIEEVAVFSGHTDWKMLQRYTHIHARDLHRD